MQGQPAGGEATEHPGEPPPVRRRQSHPRRDRRRKRRLHGVVSAIRTSPVTPAPPSAAAPASKFCPPPQPRLLSRRIVPYGRLNDGGWSVSSRTPKASVVSLTIRCRAGSPGTT